MSTRDIFEQGTAAWNAHDLDAFGELIADDVAFAAPGGLQGHGRAACVEFYAGWIEAFPDAHVDVAEVHVISDVVVERGTFTGTHGGVLRTPAGEVPPTGRPVVLDYVHVLRIERGRHVSFDLMFDRLALLEQLGLAEAPLAPRHGR